MPGQLQVQVSKSVLSVCPKVWGLIKNAYLIIIKNTYLTKLKTPISRNLLVAIDCILASFHNVLIIKFTLN